MEEKLLCHIIIINEHKAVDDKKIAKQIVSAYKWDRDNGPVICFCNDVAYEYLVRNNLDQNIYLDVIVSSGDIDEDTAKKMIGEGSMIEFEYPFLTPFISDKQVDIEIDELPERFAVLCRDTMRKEFYLSNL